MKKKIIITIILFIIFSVWCVNFINLNKKTEAIPEVIYPMNTFVEYKNSFFNSSKRENKNGYSIMVLDAEVIEYNEYVKKHKLKINNGEDVFVPKYVYDVKVKIKNENNKKHGIDMYFTTLNGVNFSMHINDVLWAALYPQLYGSNSFSIKPESEMEFHFPYCVDNEEYEKIIDKEYFLNNKFYLSVSEYPESQKIEVFT